MFFFLTFSNLKTLEWMFVGIRTGCQERAKKKNFRENENLIWPRHNYVCNSGQNKKTERKIWCIKRSKTFFQLFNEKKERTKKQFSFFGSSFG
jgi:hypothetical protein